MTVLRFRGNREQIYAIISKARRILAGQEADTTGIVNELWERIGYEAMQIIYEAFLVKMTGRTDAAGLQWATLSDATIADKKGDSRILYRTGQLLASYLKGGGGDTLVEARAGTIWLITEVMDKRGRKYFKYHHSRDRRRINKEGSGEILRRRPLWQDTEFWPREWLLRLIGVLRSAVIDLIVALARSTGKAVS